MNRRRFLSSFLCSGAALEASRLLPKLAASPLDHPPIKLGMTAALSGPSGSLGRSLRAGIEIALWSANQNGGIAGRPIDLIVLDDGYRRDLARQNMHRLLVQHRVLATIGNVGTPTALETMKLAIRHQTVFFGALTGASLLRTEPPERCVWNFRASYDQEVRDSIRGILLMGIRPYELAFFTQNDAFGDAVFTAATDELYRLGLPRDEPLIHARYERNTLDVEAAALTFFAAETPPRAVILGGTYLPCAKFIRIVRPMMPHARFVNISFVGSSELQKTLGKDAEGVVITQVVPAFDSGLPIIEELRGVASAAPRSAPLNQVVLEGYVAARLLLEGLRRARAPLTRDSLLQSLEGLGSIDLGLGTELWLDSQRHQACNRVWPTIVQNGELRSFSWKTLARSAQ